MSFITNIFHSNSKPKIKNFELIGTDIHSHLVPNIDDGSDSLEASVEMIKEMRNLGYKKLITTPHIMVDYYQNTPEIINKGFDQLKQRLADEQIDIEISAAAEYHIDCFILKKVAHENVLTLKDKYLLFELSYFNKPTELENILFELQVARFKLILAHPERYSYFHHNFVEYQKLKDRGILFQMNINSLAGLYAKESKIMAEKLIKEGMIELIGSDIHRIDQVQLLRQALQNKYLIELIESGKLLNDKLF